MTLRKETSIIQAFIIKFWVFENPLQKIYSPGEVASLAYKKEKWWSITCPLYFSVKILYYRLDDRVLKS